MVCEPTEMDTANRPVIHAPYPNDLVGPNVTVAGRTGSEKPGLITVMTDIFVGDILRISSGRLQNRTNSEGRFRMRVGTPLPLSGTKDTVRYLIRVVELDDERKPRGPEAWVLVVPK
jgi:hypothetical protein